MDDVISRQQAIDAVLNNEHSTDITLIGDAFGKGYTEGYKEEQNNVLQYLADLPSAEPTFDARDTQYNLPIGTDLISRQAILDKFEPWLKVKDYNDGELNMLKAILYEIRFMRSAQPEIIRCKDCKKYDMHDHRCKHWNHGVVVMDWCSKAERRTDG
jgi:hypothetical protein